MPPVRSFYAIGFVILRPINPPRSSLKKLRPIHSPPPFLEESGMLCLGTVQIKSSFGWLLFENSPSSSGLIHAVACKNPLGLLLFKNL